jgi:hypothetical protein
MNDLVTAPEDPRVWQLLDPDATARLRGLQAEVEADPRRIGALFPGAARTVARGPLDRDDSAGLLGPTVDDQVRRTLLLALARATAPDHDRLASEVAALYRYGDTEETRAVLRSLHLLPVGAEAVPLLRDALRTNDLRLVAAALGPYATEHLDDAAWRHGVLKCLFVGVPLAAVDGLQRRADAELGRMVASFVEERRAAGRSTPPDAWRVLDRPTPEPEEA